MTRISINSNIQSLIAQRRLSESTARGSTAAERLASGSRINKASDDAAGLAIAADLNSRTRVFSQAIRNVNDGFSYLSIADGALQELSNITTRQIELAEQSANGSFSGIQRLALNKEVQALSSEFKRIVESTTFNDKKVLDIRQSRDGIRIQAGYGVAESVAAAIGNDLARGTGTGEFTNNGSFNSMPSGLVYGGQLADINNDGNLDYIVAGDEGGGYGIVRTYIGNGQGTFNAGASFQVFDTSPLSGQSHSGAFDLVDLNNDGYLDIVAGASGEGATSRGILQVHINDGAGQFTLLNRTSTDTGGQFGGAYKIAAVDIDGDGSSEIAVRYIIDGTTEYSNEVRIYHNTNGILTEQTRLQFSAPSSQTTNAASLSFGDFNNDGRTDILASEQTSIGGAFPYGVSSVFFNQGGGSFTHGATFISVPSAVTSGILDTAVGDFNNDGNLDLVTVGAESFGDSGSTNIFFGNGAGQFSLSQRITTNSTDASTSSQTESVQVKDINGDGLLDFVTAGIDGVSGAWRQSVKVLLNNGVGQFSIATSLTNAPPGGITAEKTHSIALGDINKDGSDDIITTSEHSAPSTDGRSTIYLGTASKTSFGEIIDVLTIIGARKALEVLRDQLDRIGSERGAIGAFESRLHTTQSNLQSARENYQQAASRIQSADVAQEAGNAIRERILQSVGANILYQANLVPSIALKLLQS